MDKLFTELLLQIDQLNILFEKAPSSISESGVKKDKPTEHDLERWQELVETVKGKTDLLKSELSDGIDEKNKKVVNLRLGFFRQLPRQMDYYPVYWSAYYQDIDVCMDNIYDLLVDIDTKYHLGQHADDW